MKRSLIILSLIATSAFAAKGKMGIDSRMGFVKADNDIKKTGEAPESRFKLERVKFFTEGMINDEYGFELNINAKTNDTTNDSTASTDLIDTMIITHSPIENVNLTFGKFGAFVGGWEWDYSGADQYQYSYFGDNNVPADTMGLQLAYEVMGQTLVAQVRNGDTDNEGTRQQGYFAGWNGNLLDGMILPIVGYGVEGHGEGVKNTYTTAGVRFDLPMFLVEADYLKYVGENATTTNKDDTTTAMVFLARLKGENFRPFVKYSMDEVEKSDAKWSEYTRMTAALEYYPKAKENFRYHLAYTTDEMTPKGTNTAEKYSKNAIYAGIRAKFDFLNF